jgi:UDP-4-amino-4-deoxy-L-arabinose-oxoglutarate aminotransferase
LILALQSLNLKQDSEVILPTYVCGNVLDAILTIGARPVLCDVGENWVITSATVEPHITNKTGAIIAVHMFGIGVDVDSLNNFGVPIIEDACQAFGLSINNKLAGSIGSIGVFSFHATKCITTGEGGMITSNNKQIIERARALRDGQLPYNNRVPSPMSDLQATLGISQLNRYKDFLDRRQSIRDYYIRLLNTSIFCESCESLANNNFLFRFPLRTHREFRDLQNKFLEHKIHVRRGVDQLLHRLLGFADCNFPKATQLFEETLSIPYYPALSEQEYNRVGEAVIKICH